ncbi:hypothetical protein JOF56_001566 [Kibdelosporangium banguiense]|uniref:LamG-like jellyroll fold domain-containing protein n=1 Tax=Kibdelosporangium banguiense TaxID=1365924 RepID=A0ABS4T9S6_9PSEU|nr:LamG-like jellyroll fold domain-containing protein [Kibdelosporangium banguiense]MBP2321181.1 hypothetical protein [Kibdelosporangium banguiense]
MVGRRTGALACALLVTLGVMGVVQPPVAMSQQGVTQPETPTVRAKRTGQHVELPEQTSPTTRVFAEPDGTYTMEQNVVPVRGRKDGGWAPIDNTLTFAGNSTVQAKVGAVAQTFSAGGSGPLVTIADGAAKLELTWPRPLPRPELAGDTAIYREVLPGVDLKLRATRQGYAKVLVVKDRAAASNPELRKLSFGLKSAGLTVRREADGTAKALDKAGKEVFQTGKPVMWDATKNLKQIPIEVAADHLAVLPDQALLTGPDTQYPVEIDPDWTVGRAAWALVYGWPVRYAGNSYWFGDGDNIAKVGYSAWEVPAVTARSYFQFDVSGVIGKHVLSAEFNAFEFYSSSCEARPLGLHETGSINPSTSWNNQPWIGQELARVNVAYGHDAGCPGKWLGFNVINAVNNSVAGRSPTTTLMFKAVDEGDTYAWKKFDPNNVSLIVKYNSIPAAPLFKTTDGKDCTLVPQQAYIYNGGPTLKAKPTDPDGGNVKVEFEWYIKGGAWKGSTTTLNQPENTTFGVTIPAGTFTEGQTISWRARTSDGIDWSPWSNDCDATVDTKPPVNPPIVSSTDYPEFGVGGGIGQTGAFTLQPQGDADVVAYKYALHDDPQQVVQAKADGTATALVTPDTDAWLDFYARSVDRAGNVGPVRRYHFRAGIGKPPVGLWRMDSYALSMDAPDGSGNGNHGKVILNGATYPDWSVGRQDDAVHLAGQSYVSTARPAIRTDNTFTVAAWVKADLLENNIWRTAVSQDGTVISAFFLQLSPEHTWRFQMTDSDSDNGRQYVDSDQPAVAGRWTHIAGAFDKSTSTISLYVDGIKQSRTALQRATWNATGATQIGRGLAARTKLDFFKGSIDDVRLYDRLLSQKEMHALATIPTVDEAFYQLDEKSGTGVADVSGNRRQATLSGGASWTEISAVGGGALHLDGATGQVTTGTHIRTDNSFTVAAHVRLTDANEKWQTAVSQDGPKGSGWALRYRPDTKAWSFGLSPQDIDNPAYIDASSPEPAQVGDWVQLTGVYDEADRQVRLYVNSVLVAATPIPAGTRIPEVAGDLVLGRGRVAGASARFWGGEIDQVRVFTGARTEDQIADDARAPRPPAPSLYSGQFSRWITHGWEHVTSNDIVPRGYHFEAPLGFPAPAGAPNTRMLYSCISGTDEFTSTDPACEGKRVLGELGRVYTTVPAGVAGFALYRCAEKTKGELFVSPHADCEGIDATQQGLLGYSRAYKYLTRYRELDGAGELRSTAHMTTGDYRAESSLGVVANFGTPGGHGLVSCRNGSDYFLSNQADCEGKQAVEWTATVWDVPTGAATVELLRCKARGTNELFESVDPGCEGGTVDRSLGYVMPNPEGIPQ